MPKHIWNIPRTDKRERCAKCLKVLKEIGYRSGLSTMMRFTKICGLCAPEYFGKREPELTLNNPNKITKDLHL